MVVEIKRKAVRYVEVTQPDSFSLARTESFGHGVQPGSSWRAITTMITALLFSILFTTARHLLNNYLDGRDVDDVNISSRWVSRINVALAFQVKTCLVITIGVAFVQRQWVSLRQESLRVREIDALTRVLVNTLNFFNVSVWFHHPLLTLIALISWDIDFFKQSTSTNTRKIIPIATIVTPGSISLAQKRETNVINFQVLQHDWAAEAYSKLPCCGAGGTVYATSGTNRIAYTSTRTANSLQFPYNFPTQSYRLTFYGPTVQCGMANSTIIDMVSRFAKSQDTNPVVTTYMSWVPGSEASFGMTPNNQSDSSASTGSGLYHSTLDEQSSDTAKIYVMAITNSFKTLVTECHLYNVTYNVNFNFTYPEQHRDILSIDILNPVSSWFEREGPMGVDGYKIASYASVMDAYGRLLVGANYNDQYGSNTKIQTVYNLLSINWDEANSTYQGLESLFHNITLSFLSDDTFTKNHTEATFIPVTATFWPLKYVYTPWELWLAYGLSCGVAFICLLIGIQAFIENGGSYQNIFSTFVRATSRHELRLQVDIYDNSADPLSKHLGNTRIPLKQD